MVSRARMGSRKRGPDFVLVTEREGFEPSVPVADCIFRDPRSNVRAPPFRERGDRSCRKAALSTVRMRLAVAWRRRWASGSSAVSRTFCFSPGLVRSRGGAAAMAMCQLRSRPGESIATSMSPSCGRMKALTLASVSLIDFLPVAEPIEIIDYRVANGVGTGGCSTSGYGGEPIARLGLCLSVADREKTVRLKRVIGGTERRLQAQPIAHDLREPHATLRAFAIAQCASRRERHPIGRATHGQPGAGGAGIKLRIADGTRHMSHF